MGIETSSCVRDDRAANDWTRSRWIAYADRLLDGVRTWASPGFALITPPGAAGGYGRGVDGLEGFARTFLLAGFRIAGARGEGVDRLVVDYARGIAAGVDPDGEDRWVRLDEHPQAKVEAASLALILDMTRPWIWDRLDARTQQRVIDYLCPVVGDDTYPRNNWLWFRLVVQTFLRSVGGPWSAADIVDDLARHESYVRDDGWLSDGDGRAYDHYVGWALHLYPVLWARMRGADELSGGRAIADVARLDRYLQDAVALVGGDGSPLIQGRSLIYRFAAAAPFWAGALAEVPSVPAGMLRRAASAIVGHFAAHDVPDGDGLLSMGWHAPWRRLAQSYSGPASPYWAVKGLLGIALPADHPAWTAPAEPLPVERSDTLRAVRAPGWIVSGTAADGIVRVVNHGTDHAAEGDAVGDSPLYARLGYSTASAPLHDSRAWREPLDQSVVLVRGDGAATHRAGMTLLDARIEQGVGIAGSLVRAHWLDPHPVQQRHGSGLAGRATDAARMTVWSLVRGAWEVRLIRVDEVADGQEAAILRVGGWPVAGGRVETSEETVSAGGVVSMLHPLGPGASSRVIDRDGASPLGTRVAVPVLEYRIVVDEWIPVAVGLAAISSGAPSIDALDAHDRFAIHWPDGDRTVVALTDGRLAMAADR